MENHVVGGVAILTRENSPFSLVCHLPSSCYASDVDLDLPRPGNPRYQGWFCRNTSEKQPFFLRAKIAAIFTVYIGPRENDDKEYLFFLTSPGSASLLKGYHKLVLVLVALDEKRNSGLWD